VENKATAPPTSAIIGGDFLVLALLGRCCMVIRGVVKWDRLAWEGGVSVAAYNWLGLVGRVVWQWFFLVKLCNSLEDQS
jgi:hypothetical protein